MPVCQIFLSSYLFSLRVRGRPAGRSQEEAQIESGEGGDGMVEGDTLLPFYFLPVCAKKEVC